MTTAYEVTVSHFDGQYRPYRAVVRANGVYVGTTGPCKGPEAARRAAEKIVKAHKAVRA